jgi:hypothetical protein
MTSRVDGRAVWLMPPDALEMFGLGLPLSG